MLAELDYLNIGTDKWTGDARLDTLIEQTINNYTIKYKELDAVLKREKYNLTNGGRTPDRNYPAGQSVHCQEAQVARGRQDGRPSR